MNPLQTYLLLIAITILSCKQSEERNRNILIDNKIDETAKNNIRLVSDEYSSYFETKVFAQFYTNDSVTETVNDDKYRMMSWYSINKDTIDLVVHVSSFVTESLLLRFIKDSIKVMLLRAAHEPRPIFKLHQTDSFANFVEVPAKSYQLQLSGVPDMKVRQPVYGFIVMESNDYYEKLDSAETKNKVMMRFYFRSQYRHFDYL